MDHEAVFGAETRPGSDPGLDARLELVGNTMGVWIGILVRDGHGRDLKRPFLFKVTILGVIGTARRHDVERMQQSTQWRRNNKLFEGEI